MTETLSRLETVNQELMREVTALRTLLRKTTKQMTTVLRLEAVGWEISADVVLDRRGEIARVNTEGEITVEVP